MFYQSLWSYTNKTLEQKVKASMATSLYFIEHSIIIRLSELHTLYIAELTPLYCQDSQPHSKLR